MQTSLLRRAAACLALVAAMALAGCAGSPSASPSAASNDGSSDALTQMIDDGIAQAQSDFQKEVLTRAKETGTISEADWKEANNRYKACLSEQGIQAEIVYQGSKVQVQAVQSGKDTPESREASQKADLACYQKTSAFINEIYAYLNDDGSGNGMDGDTAQRAVLKCLIDRQASVPRR